MVSSAFRIDPQYLPIDPLYRRPMAFGGVGAYVGGSWITDIGDTYIRQPYTATCEYTPYVFAGTQNAESI